MPLQRSTLGRISCFAIAFPFLGTTEYPQAPFAVAKVSQYWAQKNTLRPLLHLVTLQVYPNQSRSSNKTNSLEPS
jgi:hypothetical protein